MFALEKSLMAEIQSAILNIREAASLQTIIENNSSLIELVKKFLDAEQQVEFLDRNLKECFVPSDDLDQKAGDEDRYLVALKEFQRAQAELKNSKPAGYKLETQMFSLNTVDRKEARQFILSEKIFMESIRKVPSASYCITCKIYPMANDINILRVAVVKVFPVDN